MDIFDLLYFGLKVLFASFAIMLGIWLSCWCAGFIYCVGELASMKLQKWAKKKCKEVADENN